jgi:chromosome segregation ATPase
VARASSSAWQQVKILLKQVSAITDTCAANSRKARDDSWEERRVKLDGKSADTFEKALADDDHIRDERLAASDRLSQLHLAEQELAETDSRLKFLADEINRIERSLQSLQDEMWPVFLVEKRTD